MTHYRNNINLAMFDFASAKPSKNIFLRQPLDVCRHRAYDEGTHGRVQLSSKTTRLSWKGFGVALENQ